MSDQPPCDHDKLICPAIAWAEKEIARLRAAPSPAAIEAAAAAIANARGARRGAPAVSNILTMLKTVGQGRPGGTLYDDVMEEARVALEAAERFRVGES
jgi:hypothetical protein